MQTIQLDFCDDALEPTDDEARTIAVVRAYLNEHGYDEATFSVREVHGPGGGWPVIDFTMSEALMRPFLMMYTGNDIEDVDWMLSDRVTPDA